MTAARQQPRHIARELAILGLSQMSRSPEVLAQKTIEEFLLTAIQTLTTEARELLETASGEIRRSREQLALDEQETLVSGAKATAQEGIRLAESALERIGYALDLPEFTQVARQSEVRDFAIEMIETVHRRKAEIQEILSASLVHWTLDRLPQVDRHILMLAVAEIQYLQIPQRVVINEAVELAKQYSDDEGARFINGVLRRVSDHLKALKRQARTEAAAASTDEAAAPVLSPDSPTLETTSQLP